MGAAGDANRNQKTGAWKEEAPDGVLQCREASLIVLICPGILGLFDVFGALRCNRCRTYLFDRLCVLYLGEEDGGLSGVRVLEQVLGLPDAVPRGLKILEIGLGNAEQAGGASVDTRVCSCVVRNTN